MRSGSQLPTEAAFTVASRISLLVCRRSAACDSEGLFKGRPEA